MIFVPLIIGLLLLVLDRSKQRPPGARSPYKAAAASLFLPGLGQLYNGEPRKSITIWSAGLVLILASVLGGLFQDFWSMAVVMTAALALSVWALLDALRTAKRRQSYELQAVNRWYFYVGAFALAALASIPVDNALGVQAFKIPVDSMRPSLYAGDFIIARLESPESYEDERGDVLVFKYPGDNRTMYIKRVIGLPGEEVEIRAGTLLVNGQPITDTWARTIEGSTSGVATDFGPITVPDRTLFVLGDNLPHSSDSRVWGPLPRENIVGVAEFVYFSWDPRTKSVRFNRIGQDVEGGE